MTPAWSLEKRLYGTDQPATQRTYAALGAMRFCVEGPQLRYLSVHGTEVVRAVGLVIRDAWWGSHVLDTGACHLDATAAQWHQDSSGQVRDDSGQLLLDWQLILHVSHTGLVAKAQLMPHMDFTTCRAGLMLLHPLEGVVGAPVAVTHSDGQVEHGHFPSLISPGQPFFDIREMRHAPAPGLNAHWRLSGDVFEMEDQRNWCDASFKTYNRPLAWACPYVLEAGSCVEQQIELALTGEAMA